jgi:integrase/recombinase XerD
MPTPLPFANTPIPVLRPNGTTAATCGSSSPGVSAPGRPDRSTHPSLHQPRSTPLITRYRSYLQHTQHLKPTSVNRALVSIKRYVAWAVETGQLGRNVAAPAKLIPIEDSAPRHLDDTEEGRRSGFLCVYGKRNKYREGPLNATARTALTAYLPELADTESYLFPPTKTDQALSERALGHLIKKNATLARLSDVSPHDLRHRFGYRMAETVPLHRLAQMMGHDAQRLTE